jgi:hypothetical protein
MKTSQRLILLFLSIILWISACALDLQKVDLGALLIQPGDLSPEYVVRNAKDMSQKRLERLAGFPLPLKGSEQVFEREGEVHVGDQKGYVRAFLFETKDDLAEVYASMENKIKSSDAELNDSIRAAWKSTIRAETSVGDAALLEIVTYPFAHSIGNNKVEEFGGARLLFRRCHAIARMEFGRVYQQVAVNPTGSQRASGISAELATKDLLAYAKQLDTRLKKNVCP